MKPPRQPRPTNKWLNIEDTKGGPYNAWDVRNTALLAKAQEKELESNGQLAFFRSWFRGMVPVVLAIQRRGMGHLDLGRKSTTRRRLRAEIREVEANVLTHVTRLDQADREAAVWGLLHYCAHGIWGRRSTQRAKGIASRVRKVGERREKFFNASNDLRAFLYDDLGLKPAPKTRERTERALSQEALIYVLTHLRKKDTPHRAILLDLLHRSRLHTIDSRYLGITAWPDGRVRPTVKLYGTKTLRLAYADPALQQWPAEIRSIIVPTPGKMFVARDYGQLEARILAQLSQDQRSLEAFSMGHDIHAANAQDLFGLNPTEWHSLPKVVKNENRQYAKSFLYKISYGGSPDSDAQKQYCPCSRCIGKVPQVSTLSKAEMKEAGARWFRAHPEVTRFRNQLKNTVANGSRTYLSPFGWKRMFFGRGPELEREIYNFPMQHCAAMIINRAMIELHRRGAPLVLQMHDELVLEVPEDEVQDWADELGAIMEEPVEELGGMVFPTDLAVAKSWGELKDG